MNYSKDEIDRFRHLYTQGVLLFKEKREKEIEQLSCYSHLINNFIRSVDELNIYSSLKLNESYITRPSLLLNIDINFKDCDGVDNLTRMLHGNPPIDTSTNSVVDLHHIGQQFNSPFAELPHKIHNSTKYYSILHQSNIVSWRNNKKLLQLTQTEVSTYWKTRGEMYL